jgi:branched-chain amino acid transport system permease protein
MRHVSTSVLDVGLSVNAILWAVLGGVGTVLGPLLGILIVYPLTEVVAVYFVYVQILIGLLLVVVAIVFPKGVLGTLDDLTRSEEVGPKPRNDTPLLAIVEDEVQLGASSAQGGGAGGRANA